MNSSESDPGETLNSSGTIDSIIFQIAYSMATLPDQDYGVRGFMESFIQEEDLESNPYLHVSTGSGFRQVLSENIDNVDDIDSWFRKLVSSNRLVPKNGDERQFGIATAHLSGHPLLIAYVGDNETQFIVGNDLALLDKQDSRDWTDLQKWQMYTDRDVLVIRDKSICDIMERFLPWDTSEGPYEVVRRTSHDSLSAQTPYIKIGGAGLAKSYSSKITREHKIAALFYNMLGIDVVSGSRRLGIDSVSDSRSEQQYGIVTIDFPGSSGPRKLHIGYLARRGEIYMSGEDLGMLTPDRSFIWAEPKRWSVFENENVLKLRDELNHHKPY